MHRCAAAILPLALAGCSSITIEFTSGGEPLVDDAKALESKAASLAVSPSLPLASSVSMSGVMVLGSDLSTAGERTLGQFQATADFASGTITGAGTGFIRGPFDAAGNTTGRTRDVAGTVTADSTTFSAARTVMLYDGALDIGGTVEPVSGTGVGQFLGPNGDMFVSTGSVAGDTSATVLDIRILAD